MAFLDDMKEKLTQASQTTVKKAKDLTELARLNSEVSATEKQVSEMFQRIGAEIYNVYRENPQPEVKDLVAQVIALEEKIASLKEQIQTISAEGTCPQCGAKIKQGMAFCSGCGYKLIPPVEETAQETAAEATGEANPKICGACGTEVATDAMFCPSCGAKCE